PAGAGPEGGDTRWHAAQLGKGPWHAGCACPSAPGRSAGRAREAVRRGGGRPPGGTCAAGETRPTPEGEGPVTGANWRAASPPGRTPGPVSPHSPCRSSPLSLRPRRLDEPLLLQVAVPLPGECRQVLHQPGPHHH